MGWVDLAKLTDLSDRFKRVPPGGLDISRNYSHTFDKKIIVQHY